MFCARFSSGDPIGFSEGSLDAFIRNGTGADRRKIVQRPLDVHLMSRPGTTSRGETLMAYSKNAFHQWVSGFLGDSSPPKRRRVRQMTPAVDGLEDRVVLSHFSAVHHHHVHHTASVQAATTSTATAATALTASESTGTSSTSTSSSTLKTARQTLQNDIQTIELASGTTIGELTAIHAAFKTLASDGLTPSSGSALSSVENSLVQSYANGTTLTGNATLLAQFEALYTSSPTTQETTDLTTAYNALAAAITSSNITSSDLSTIDADYAAVLAAESSTSTATFPYFTLVTGGGPGGFGPAGGFGGPGGNMQGGCGG
jgi:hypothetical protein